MSGADGRGNRTSRVEQLDLEAERIEDEARWVRDQLDLLVRTHRSLIPYGPDIWAESTVVRLNQLIEAGQDAREDLARAHNALLRLRAQGRSIEAAPSLGHECGGATEPRHLLRSEEYIHHAILEAKHVRSKAELHVHKMMVAQRDGSAMGKEVAALQSRQIFNLLVDRVDGDLLVKLYRVFLACSRDLDRLEGLCDFLVTLSDLPDNHRRQLIVGGLHEFSRATLGSTLRRLFRRRALSDDIYRAISEED